MEPAILFSIGFVSSFLGSLSSGVLAMLSLTLLGVYGLAPLTALAVFRVGTVGSSIGGLYDFFKAKKIVWKRIIPFTVIGLVASYIGANIVLSLGDHNLNRIIGVAILVFIPFSLYKPRVGLQHVVVSKTRERLGYVWYFLISIWGGSFSVGTGIFAVFNQAYSFGMTLLEIKGTNKIPGLIKSILVLFIFANAGVVDWYLGGFFCMGMIVGSLLGARFALRKGDEWLRNILLVTIAFLALKLILGL